MRFSTEPRSSCSVLAAVVVAAITVTGCGSSRDLSHSRTSAAPSPNVTSPGDARSLLESHGIGSIMFGQPRAAVAAGLERLLGPVHDPWLQLVSRLSRLACNSDHAMDWIGLRIRSKDPHLTGQLTAYFKRSRFVAYDYLENFTDPVLTRQGAMLSTTRGLVLEDTVADARRLYRRAFVETGMRRSPRGSLRPVWEVRTSGQIIYGGYVRESGRMDRATARSTITDIGAGPVADTRCR